MRRSWLQIYEGVAIALLLLSAMANPLLMAGTAALLLIVGLVAFPTLRKRGLLAAVAGLVVALAVAAIAARP